MTLHHLRHWHVLGENITGHDFFSEVYNQRFTVVVYLYTHRPNFSRVCYCGTVVATESVTDNFWAKTTVLV